MIKLSPSQWTAFNFFGFFGGYGIFMPFFPIWFESHQYSSETIGLLFASGYVFRLVGNMLIPQWVKSPSQSLNTLRLLTIITIIIAVLMALFADSMWILFSLFALFNIVSGGSMTMSEATASTWQQQAGIDYGKTRLFGSLGFVIISIFSGYYIGWFGEKTIIWLFVGLSIFLILGQLFRSHTPLRDDMVESNTDKSASKVSYFSLLKDPIILRMLVVTSLIQASHVTYYTFSTIYWKSQGVEPQVSSLLWSLSVGVEMIFFFVSGKFFAKKPIHHLIIISAIFCMLRWGIFATTVDIPFLILAQTFHAFTFGLAHFAMIRYISTQPANMTTKLQGIYLGLSNSGFMAIFAIFSSITYDYSPTASFLLMVLSVIPVLFIVPKDKNTLIKSIAVEK